MLSLNFSVILLFSSPSQRCSGRTCGSTIRAQAPGSVDGRLKVTEQGEVIAARYANPEIARRELELMSGAVLIASTPEHDASLERAAADGAPVLDELAATARSAYRALVYDDPHGHPHLFTGDCLFPGGVGNTWKDPEAFASLLRDVETKLFAALPDETWVYPGHGKDTTLGDERPHLPEWRERGW